MRKSKIAVLAVATILFALGYTVAVGTHNAVPSVHAVSKQFTLEGGFTTGWNGTNPGPILNVTQGDSITLKLVSVDGAPHTFVIDVAKAGIISNPDCTVDKCSSQFSSSTTFTFTADMAAGNYSYYCSIHLQEMVGTLRVQSASSSGSPTPTPPTTPAVGKPTSPSGISSTILILAGIVIMVIGVGAASLVLARRRRKA